MEATNATFLPLHVVNSGGRDPDRAFPEGAGRPQDPGHPPINYHAYAACTRGSFLRSVHSLPSDARAALLLLRPKHLGSAMKALRELRERGLRVYISLKESGLQQVGTALSEPARWRQFVDIATSADGFISSTSDLVPLYRAAGCEDGDFVPTPYPVDCEPWNFSRPLHERQGLFVGTREFGVSFRNHLAALATATTLGHPMTVINTEGRRGEKMIRAISPSIRIVRGPLPYVDYLRMMAGHRIVFQCDRGAVPGQVAGDALLCRMPCLGGDSAIERLTFGEPPSQKNSHETCLGRAAQLLQDDATWLAQVEASQSEAMKTVSFHAIAAKLLKLTF